MKNIFFKKAFTLAEIMIVLTVIGILTAILLPTAFHTSPDENIMKFKKANSTLYRVIRELVSSSQYYKDGDLGIRANGTLIDGTHDGDYTYFCQTFADILSTKSVNCSDTNSSGHGLEWLNESSETNNLAKLKIAFDSNCKWVQTKIESEIVTVDGVVFYQVNSYLPFGVSIVNGLIALGGNPNGYDPSARYFKTNEDFHDFYKTFCIDTDGMGKGEAPFGYGIRVDGKIITGARADEWIEKSIQQKE